jgi:hypothetical protein
VVGHIRTGARTGGLVQGVGEIRAPQCRHVGEQGGLWHGGPRAGRAQRDRRIQTGIGVVGDRFRIECAHRVRDGGVAGHDDHAIDGIGVAGGVNRVERDGEDERVVGRSVAQP